MISVMAAAKPAIESAKRRSSGEVFMLRRIIETGTVTHHQLGLWATPGIERRKSVLRGNSVLQTGADRTSAGWLAIPWLNKYLEEARPKLIVEPDEREVFLCVSGPGLTPGVLSHVVHGYVEASGVNRTGSCHLFHHAMAALMLENDADLRYVQQMLGHARLNRTEIYTHVNIQELIEVHRLTHPAKLPEAGLEKSPVSK